MSALTTIVRVLNGGVMMCEFCHRLSGHSSRCPNASDPEVKGHCVRCGFELREDYEYYMDSDDNKFCSTECACEYHGIKSVDWE